MRAAPVSVEYFSLEGGLDLISSSYKIRKGALIDSKNFDIPSGGGYRRIPGYERYDGHERPSSASAVVVASETAFGAAAVLGAYLTGETSGSTGKIIYISADRSYLAITRQVGTLVIGENLLVGAEQVGFSSDLQTSIAPADYRIMAALAANEYRSSISVVPGAGPVRGVWVYKDNVYAFRDNVGGTACVMYKATSTGWSAVPFQEELFFTNANVGVEEGDQITKGSVTASIRRVLVRTGTLESGVNSGSLVIELRSGGNFSAGAATTPGGSLTLTGIQTQITLPPNGKFNFVNYNFIGSADGERMYGANGKGPAFEFDGTFFAPIHTGMPSQDNPSFVVAHNRYLMLAFSGSLQISAIGNPYSWSVVLGAGELGLGENITALKSAKGDNQTGALLIFTRNATHVLYGTGSTTWQLQTMSPENGALPFTVQNIVDTISLDDIGLTSISSTQEFGNFGTAEFSALVRPLVAPRVQLATCSVVSRKDNQYRLFFDDGTAIVATFVGRKVSGIMPISFPVTLSCACDSEKDGGMMLVGSDNGFVYELDRGTSFDGEMISASLRTSQLFGGNPMLVKRYRSATIDMTSEGDGEVTFSYILSRGDDRAGVPSSFQRDFGGGSEGFDEPDKGFDEIGFDADPWARMSVQLYGSGTDISLLISSNSDNMKPFTMTGGAIRYSARRSERY